MALSDAKLKTLKPKIRPYKVADAHGLYVIVSPAGGVAWKFNFVLGGKQKTLSLGRWPAVSLHAARDLRNAAQRMLAEGLDPAAAKQERKREAAPTEKPTFEECARDWHASRTPKWTDSYARQVLNRLEDDVFPAIGSKLFAEITRQDLHGVLEQVEKRGVGETVRKLRQYIGAIHRYAGARDDSVSDPTPFLRQGRRDVPNPVHHAMLPLDGLGEFVVKVDQYDGEPETRLALRFTLLTAARTMEVLGATWDEFSDWEDESKLASALWRIPGERMKSGDPHMIPLSKQACALLRKLHEITGEGARLFPVHRTTPGRRVTMSNNAMLFAMYRLGYRGRATVHGFRRNFSTWANEEGWPADDIELCLAHDERDRVRGAYNAAKRLEPRRKLLQAWANHITREANKARLG